MVKIFLFAVFISFSAVSCNKEHAASRDSFEYFNSNLKASMTYTDIVALFGNPDGDLGSGIHIYYFNLNDGTSIWIGYTDKILYARHMSSSNTNNAQLLHTII